MSHRNPYDTLLCQAGGKGASALAVVRAAWRQLSPHGKGQSARFLRRRLIRAVLLEHQARKETTS